MAMVSEGEEVHLSRCFYLAPRAGFEPATNRLTAGCSTAELPGNTGAALQAARITNAPWLCKARFRRSDSRDQPAPSTLCGHNAGTVRADGRYHQPGL